MRFNKIICCAANVKHNLTHNNIIIWISLSNKSMMLALEAWCFSTVITFLISAEFCAPYIKSIFFKLYFLLTQPHTARLEHLNSWIIWKNNLMMNFLALKILTVLSVCNEQSDPEWLNVYFLKARPTSSGILLAKARPPLCCKIDLFPCSLDSSLISTQDIV